jgi:D-sedoheptulose 7-phosphate isomerase
MVTDYFHRVADVLPRIPAEPVDRIVEIMTDAQVNQRTVFMIGNGGSSANASHIVNDLVKSALHPARPRFRVMCLTDNTPTLTAYSNDDSYDVALAKQIEAFGEPGDVVFALSGSGNSPNVIKAMETAQAMCLTRIGLTGRDGGKLAPLCDVAVIVPSDSMQIIEDAHLVILHAMFLQLMEEK